MADDPIATRMTGFPLLQGFTSQGAQRLIERGEIKELRPGEILFREGDAPDFVLLVLAGNIQVFVERGEGDLILTDAGPGTVLGELAVLCAMPRAASVRATDTTTVLQWSASNFRSLLLRYPLLSERIFKESLRNLVVNERSLIDSVIRLTRGEGKPTA
jgi:CRP-like cAMP-binding protein